MKRSVRWVAVGIAAVLVAAYTVTYVIVGRFMDECYADWDLDEED